MAVSTSPPPGATPRFLATRIEEVRASVKRWFLIDGWGRTIWTAIALAAASFAIDYLFRLDFSQRAFLLVAAIGFLIYTLVRRLTPAYTIPVSDDAVLLEVEKRHPELAEQLISAVQFSRESGSTGDYRSSAMVEAVIRGGFAAAENVSFETVIDRAAGARNRNRLLGGLGFMGVLALSSFALPHVAIWFQRNVLLRSVSWPQSTYLEIEGLDRERGVLHVPRGDDYTLEVRVSERSRVTPERVLIDFRDGRNSLAMKRGADFSSGEARFEAVLANVIQPFRFRVRGGDHLSEEIRVELTEPPFPDELTLEITAPVYAGGRTETLPAGKGPYFVLAGSRLNLRGKANKPLSKAELTIEGKRHPLEITNQREIAGEFSPEMLQTGTYVIDLRDTDSVAARNPASFGLRVREDREPRVRARTIGISGMVTPRAKIPLSYRVSDDYGVVQAYVPYRWAGDGEEVREGTGKILLPASAEAKDRKEFTVEETIDLTSLAIPTASGLTFSVAAVDADDYAPGPNVGKSPDFTVRVVTDDELRADVLRREKEQRQEFERLVKLQEELLTLSREWDAQLGSGSDLTREQLERLAQTPKNQKLIAVNSASIEQRLSLILLEISNNRLEDEKGPLITRLRTKIVAPLGAIQEGGFADSLKLLDAARRTSESPAKRREKVADLVGVQERLHAEMKRILAEMSQSEGFQEAVNMLYELQKAQQEAIGGVKKALEDRRKAILEGKEPPAESAEPEKKTETSEKPIEKGEQDRPPTK